MKRLIKSNPFLFKLWFEFYRKNRGVEINYFNHKIKFLLDGYPRSGNTFAASLVKYIFGKDVFVHHFHAIAPIKIALRKDIPIFILIRDPKEAITSNYLKTFALKNKDIPREINESLLKKLTIEYSNYYKFVYKKRNKIEIISFKDFISKPEIFLSKINSLVYNDDFKISPLQIKDAINNYGGATDTYGSSKPNAEKEKLKDILKSVLSNCEEYQVALTYFNKF
jgi:hypothetical protein